jgi:hypothetical protein
MEREKLNKHPADPEVVERVLERIRAMSPEELWEMLSWRREGVEQTSMNETLKQYYRKQQKKAKSSKVV